MAFIKVFSSKKNKNTEISASLYSCLRTLLNHSGLWYTKNILLILLLQIFSFKGYPQFKTDSVSPEQPRYIQNYPSCKKSFLSDTLLPLKNADFPLITPTPDSTSQAVHPSIIDFQHEYGMDQWSGYRYWMSYTPYFHTNAKVENPVLAASHDGINWVIPGGLKFPLLPTPAIGNYCDVDMIYNPVTNQLWIYFMYRGPVVVNGETRISGIELIKVNPDMSSTEPLLVKPFNKTDDITIVSPCIWRESADKWHMWGVYLLTPNPLVYSFSNDGINWSTDSRCTDESNNQALKSYGYYAWHMACKPNYYENRVEFLIASRQFEHDNPYNPVAIIYAQCSMDKPLIFTTPLPKPVLINDYSSKPVPWDRKLYRPSFECYRADSSYHYKIWYSAYDNNSNWHIGLTQGDLPTQFTYDEIDQYIDFDSIPVLFPEYSVFELRAKASSGLKVEFATKDTDVVNIVDNICILTGKPGRAIITAIQPGNFLFRPAPPRERILVVASTLGNDIPRPGFDIYPNPATNFIIINSKYLSGSLYEVYNAHGDICLKGILDSENVDISSLSPGIYFIKIGNYNFKIVKIP
ncbi:MAG: T9SS type A sorting domain-containing protein [Bacteroidales bacterium]|nr:T9SS type A sorting domain-containing protein [Bacteroidales bacterium]